MKAKKVIFILVLITSQISIFAQSKKQDIKINPVKNVILLIPDGTSTDLVTLSRWYNNNMPLAVDKILSGMVKTYNIDNRFPDSAPTSTAYATGVKTKAPFIGIDSASAPQISIMELARLKGLSTGIVATCEFPHATPADFVCHYNNRESGKYNHLAKQFIYNSPSLVFAGGYYYLESNKLTDSLKNNGFRLITDIKSFNENEKDSVWALFPDYNGSTKYKSFECDRNKDKPNEPSLSEMTQKAINILKQNDKGFLLMVEGSQIDWACHNNDPYEAVTEFLEFDNAVNVALKYAETTNTLVIVCPDHENGGISIGNKQSNAAFNIANPNKYDNINIKDSIIGPLKKLENDKISGRRISEMIINSRCANDENVKKYYYLSDSTVYDKSMNISTSYPEDKLKDTIQYILGSSFSSKHYIGWTTTGHAAGDVFLGIYAPKNITRLTGVVENDSIGKYIAAQLKLGNLKYSTEKYFYSHKKLFKDPEIKIKQINQDSLFVSKNGKDIVIYANTNRFKIMEGSKTKYKRLPTVAVCINKGENKIDYYIPQSILNYLK